MNEILEMEKRMTEGQKRRLRSVYAPVIVGTQPSNTFCNLCVMPDGEIRHYGKRYGERVFLSSRDAGLSWSIGDVEDHSAMCAGLRLPWCGRWVHSYYVQGEGGWQNGEMPIPPDDASGWMAVLSDEGPGGAARWVKISDLNVRVPRFPLALRTRNRVLICANRMGDPMTVAVAYSDDNGESWKTVVLESAPKHEVQWPHKSVRWQNGSCEATIAELSNGSLLLIARTSQDCHYAYVSTDGGESWSKPMPTEFHSTLTMPTLLRMESGALLLFFCNTQPLPEVDKSKLWPSLSQGEIEGKGEDVFTNRDANHAAISLDEGKTWRGFRELHLTDIRCNADFRTLNGSDGSLDKSVHQFEAMELPFGKVLLSFGQHEAARRMLVFDPKWLLEKENSEDLSRGFEHLSTQVYLKSVSGMIRTRSGHCAWNRTSGAILVPDPEGNYEEALYLKANPDERLFSPMQGVVWNFPAAKSGEVTVKLRPGEEGLSFTLSDRWFNPCDATAGELSPYRIWLYAAQCPANAWSELKAIWDEKGCEMFLNGEKISCLRPKTEAPHGLNYLILQSSDRPEGKSGSYVKKMVMKTLCSNDS